MLSWLGEQYISIVNPLLAVFGMLLGACILRKAYLRHIQKKKVKMWAYLPSQAILSIFLAEMDGVIWQPVGVRVIFWSLRILWKQFF